MNEPSRRWKNRTLVRFLSMMVVAVLFVAMVSFLVIFVLGLTLVETWRVDRKF